MGRHNQFILTHIHTDHSLLYYRHKTSLTCLFWKAVEGIDSCVPSGLNMLGPKTNTTRPFFSPLQTKRRLLGDESPQNQFLLWKHLVTSKAQMSLSKHNLYMYRSWSSYEAEHYPRDWETQKRICGGGGNSNCLWMGRQRCTGLFSKTQTVCQHHVTAWQRSGITVNGLGRIRLQWMEKAKIRRLICCEPRFAPLDVTAAAEEGRWGRPAAKFPTPLGYTGGLRSSAVSFTLTHITKRATIWDILALE